RPDVDYNQSGRRQRGREGGRWARRGAGAAAAGATAGAGRAASPGGAGSAGSPGGAGSARSPGGAESSDGAGAVGTLTVYGANKTLARRARFSSHPAPRYSEPAIPLAEAADPGQVRSDPVAAADGGTRCLVVNKYWPRLVVAIGGARHRERSRAPSRRASDATRSSAFRVPV